MADFEMEQGCTYKPTFKISVNGKAKVDFCINGNNHADYDFRTTVVFLLLSQHLTQIRREYLTVISIAVHSAQSPNPLCMVLLQIMITAR
jgi:hypothetical protein